MRQRNVLRLRHFGGNPGGARTMEQLCPTQPSAIKNTMNSNEPGYPVISALADLTQQSQITQFDEKQASYR
ncbi:MAG: hypothetical protein V7708_09660 [Oceanicoccus sp.]